MDNKFIHHTVKCSIEKCEKYIEDFGYLKDRTFFGQKPRILCQDCFSKTKITDNEDYIPYQYSDLPEYIWNPPWIKVHVMKVNIIKDR
jgi:hypothetical protein